MMATTSLPSMSVETVRVEHGLCTVDDDTALVPVVRCTNQRGVVVETNQTGFYIRNRFGSPTTTDPFAAVAAAGRSSRLAGHATQDTCSLRPIAGVTAPTGFSDLTVPSRNQQVRAPLVLSFPEATSVTFSDQTGCTYPRFRNNRMQCRYVDPCEITVSLPFRWFQHVTAIITLLVAQSSSKAANRPYKPHDAL